MEAYERLSENYLFTNLMSGSPQQIQEYAALVPEYDSLSLLCDYIKSTNKHNSFTLLLSYEDFDCTVSSINL